MRLASLLVALLFVWPVATRADQDRAAFAWQQYPGARVPLDTVLHDEAGRDVTLRGMAGRAPVILDLGYFHCPSLCGVVRSDLFQALTDSRLRAGLDYVLVSLSIDPAEKPPDAASAKAADLVSAGVAPGADWHYLTGSADAIQAVTSSVGFRSEYDTRYGQFLHPAGLVLLTRAGIVSGYLLGVGYSAGELRAGLARAAEGKVMQAASPILLLCFHYDPATGRYTLEIEKVLRVMAALTVVTLAVLFVALNRKPDNGA